MSKDDCRTETVNIFIMAVQPQHRYSNEEERANRAIYRVQIKKPFGLHSLYKK